LFDSLIDGAVDNEKKVKQLIDGAVYNEKKMKVLIDGADIRKNFEYVTFFSVTIDTLEVNCHAVKIAKRTFYKNRGRPTLLEN
jgi:F0F1-type ATP synthase delta subunit